MHFKNKRGPASIEAKKANPPVRKNRGISFWKEKFLEKFDISFGIKNKSKKNKKSG